MKNLDYLADRLHAHLKNVDDYDMGDYYDFYDLYDYDEETNTETLNAERTHQHFKDLITNDPSVIISTLNYRLDYMETEDKEAEELRKDIIEYHTKFIMIDVEDAVNAIFMKYQNQLGITSGDIEPLNCIVLDETITQLSNVIETVIKAETHQL